LTSLIGYKPEIIDIVVAVIIYFSAFAMIMNTSIKKFIIKKLKIKSKTFEEDEVKIEQNSESEEVQ